MKQRTGMKSSILEFADEIARQACCHANRLRGFFASPMAWALVVILMGSSGCNLGVRQHNVAGRQAYETGQYSTAINEFEKALNLNPNDADAYYNLGASFYALGKQSKNQQWLNKAEELYRQAISNNDQHVDAHRGLAALLIESNREKHAFDLINTWKNRYPASTEPVVELARLYQEYGDNRRATDLLADALKLDSNNVRVLKAMGHVRETQGQTYLALDNYLRALQIDNRQTDVAAKVAALRSQLAQLPANNGQGNPATGTPTRYGAAAPYLQR
jgi:tetratricopeptide (TPR) repeat protein